MRTLSGWLCSRFNLRCKPVVPDEPLTPDGVMRALAEDLDFSPVLASKTERPGLHGEGAAPVWAGFARGC